MEERWLFARPSKTYLMFCPGYYAVMSSILGFHCEGCFFNFLRMFARPLKKLFDVLSRTLCRTCRNVCHIGRRFWDSFLGGEECFLFFWCSALFSAQIRKKVKNKTKFFQDAIVTHGTSWWNHSQCTAGIYQCRIIGMWAIAYPCWIRPSWS